MSPSIALLSLLAAAGAPGPGPQETSMSIRALLDRGHPRAPDLDRVGTWLGTDRPLLFRGALKGRVVLLDFWTSGCVNCLHALPVLRDVEERFPGQPFQVVGIHSGKFDAEKEVSAVADAMARHGIEHPVGTDSDFVLWEQYAIHGWPTSVLVDARGYAVAWFRGEPEVAQLTAWIQAALDDGRDRGVLAGGPPAFQRPPPRDTGPLAFPGKVLALTGGGLAVSDSGHHRLLLLDGMGRLVRSIGSGLEGFADGPPDTSSFRSPQGLAERAGTLYVADTGNHAVRRVDLGSGRVETVAGTGAKAGGAIHASADGRTAALTTRTLPLQHVEDAAVASAGAALVLEVRLPPGHTFTAGAPERVELSVGGRSMLVAGGGRGRAPRDGSGFSSEDGVRRGVLGGALLLPGRAWLGLSGRPAAPAQSPGPHGRGPGSATVHYRPTPPGPGS